MADGGRQDVLGQKAQAAQRAFEAKGMSPAKALRRALSRTADSHWGLALVTQAVTVEMHDQDGVIDGLGSKDLLVLLDGPDGALGLAAIDREVMTGLVEVQTILQVTQMPVDVDRLLTPTDAAMMAPLLDGALELLAMNLDHHPMHPQLEGYKFGAMVEDARAVGLLLDASSYRCFRADVDLALGRRKGALTLMLPEREIRKTAELDENGQAAKGAHEDQMSRVPARLDTVLARVNMPLSQANALKVGDLLMLGTDAKDGVEVLAGGTQIVAKGGLGQMNGMRAVRLTWPPRPEPVEPPAADLPALAEPAAGLAIGVETAPAALPDLGGMDLDMGFGGDAAEPAAMDLDMDFGAEAAPEEPAFDPSAPEELPDLPSMDFEAESGALDLDLDFLDTPAEGGDDGMGDFDFSPATMD